MIPKEIAALMRPMMIPSIMNGQRTNQRVAPTYIIIFISFLLAKTVIRIVFEIMKMEIVIIIIIRMREMMWMVFEMLTIVLIVLGSRLAL